MAPTSHAGNEVWSPARLAAVRRTGMLDTGPEQAVDRFVRLAARITASPLAFASLVELEFQFLKGVVGSVAGWPDQRRIPAAACLCRHVVRTGEAFVVDDVWADDRLRYDTAAAGPVAAYLGVPLRSGDHTVGALSVADAVPREWTDDDVAMLNDLAGAVAAQFELRGRSTAEVAGAVAAERDQRRTVEALLALAERLATAVSVADVGAAAVARAGAVVDAVDTVLATVADDDGGSLEVVFASGPGGGEGDRPQVGLEDSPLGEARRRDGIVWVTEPEEIAAMFPVGPAAGSPPHRTAVAVPVDGRSVMGLAFDRVVQDTSEPTSALATAAQITAQALARVRLHRREMIIADRLQQGLLSITRPDVAGLDVAVHYSPGLGGARVGGDWFDIVHLAGDRHLVAVGDIVGHGLDAAAAMGLARHSFSAVTALNHTAADVAAQLDLVAADMAEMRYSTLSLLEVGIGAGPAQAVSAGHPPVLVRRRDGRVVRSGSTGPPLGFDTSAPRSSEEIVLGSGDVVVLYTDGLVERRDETIETGIARLAAALRDADTSGPVDGVRGWILEAVAPVGEDDVAMVVLRIS